MSFSFGTPSSAPATTGLTGGFSFGANKPATPGFGLTATSQPSTGLFGTPASSAPAFGSTATPAFGASSTPSFGATSTPAFGATSTPAFGATTAPGFGATAAPSFGATAAPSFGATAAPSFGATAAPSFGATAAPSFGATTTPAFGSTGLGTGGLNFGAATNTSTASTGLSFGAPAASTGLGGFGFGSTLASTQASVGLFGNSTTTATSSLFGPKLGATNVTGSLSSTSATPSLGLGGITTGAPGAGPGNTTTSGDGKNDPPKQIKLPNEISATVDSFKEFVKKQKAISSEIMRVSIKPFHKVEREAEELLRTVLTLSGTVRAARAQSKRLRTAGANALAAAESATRDPPNSEYEGSAPPMFVKELIAELEQQLITFRRQMDVADKQMQAAPRLLSEQELNLGIRRMHESLVALAGRLQAVHAQVEAQKEQYLNLRKYVLKDQTNVFESQTNSTSLDQIVRDVESCKKKSKLTGFDSLGSAVLADPRAALGNINQLAGPTPFSYIGTNLTPLAVADTPGSNWQPQQANFNSSFNSSGFGAFGGADNSAFQLQKPPGKRTKQ